MSMIESCDTDSAYEDTESDLEDVHALRKANDTIVNTTTLTKASNPSSDPAVMEVTASQSNEGIESFCAPSHQCLSVAPSILRDCQSLDQIDPHPRSHTTDTTPYKGIFAHRQKRRDAGLPNPARQNRYGKRPKYSSIAIQSNKSSEPITRKRKRRVDAGHPRPERTQKYRGLYGTISDAATEMTTRIEHTPLVHAGQHILMVPTAQSLGTESSPPLPSTEHDQGGNFIRTAQGYLRNNTSSSLLANKTSSLTRTNLTPEEEEDPSGTFSPSPTTSSEESERLRVTKTSYKSLYHLENCPSILYDRSSDKWFMMGQLKKDDVLRVQRNPHLMSSSKHWKVGDMVMRDLKELEREKEAVEGMIDVLRKTKKRNIEE